MLFDLSSPGRKTAVRIVFGLLALLFAVGFIGFGIGSESGSGGFFDSLTGGDGDGDTAEQFQQQIEDAESRLESNPNDERSLANLVQYRFLSGQSQLEVDEATGQPIGLSEESRNEFEAAVEAWDRYERADPARVDVTAASYAAQAFAYLGDAEGAANAQEALAEARPITNNYFLLARFRYADFDFKGGDEAADLAVKEAPADQRKQVERALDQVREQAVKLEKQTEKQAGAETGGAELESPFGGLAPDSGLPPTAP
jgi:tetratricopeptide (TPR) repeat protein